MVLDCLKSGEYVQWVILLSRDKPFKFRGLYGVNAARGSVSKCIPVLLFMCNLIGLCLCCIKQVSWVHGVGPPEIVPDNVVEFLKYDVGSKDFKPIPVKDFGPTIVAIRILPKLYKGKSREHAWN